MTIDGVNIANPETLYFLTQQNKYFITFRRTMVSVKDVETTNKHRLVQLLSGLSSHDAKSVGDKVYGEKSKQPPLFRHL